MFLPDPPAPVMNIINLSFVLQYVESLSSDMNPFSI
jgi:hypothetical protein